MSTAFADPADDDFAARLTAATTGKTVECPTCSLRRTAQPPTMGSICRGTIRHPHPAAYMRQVFA